MILYIDTTQGDNITIAIKNSNHRRGGTGRVVAQKKFKAKYSQAEKLLPMIDKLLKQNKLNIKNIKKIQVANENGSFTALRIGVVTANALGYALGVPVIGCRMSDVGSRKFDIVEPIYSKEPNITQKITDDR